MTRPHRCSLKKSVFTGGPYIVFPGPVYGDHDTIRWLLKAALLKEPPVGLKPFHDQAMRAAVLCLGVSDKIAQKAGLARGIAQHDGDDRDIVIPVTSALQRGVDAVTFSKSELVACIPAGRFFHATINPLTVDIESVHWGAHTFEFGELGHHPIVRAGDRYVVPKPSALLSGLRYRILCIAQEHDVLADLTAAYHAAVWFEIEELLRYWGSLRTPLQLPQPSPMNVTEAIFSLDSDKAMYVQLATDAVTDLIDRYDPVSWGVAQLTQDLEKRTVEAVQYLASAGIPADRILTLTILESMGRSYYAGFGVPPGGGLRLVMSASALKSMTLLDAPEDPLGLWKFARARDQMQKRARVLCLDVLDDYAIYRYLHHSYYATDGLAPSNIIIAPGSGLEVIRRVNERLDPHGVPAYEGSYLMEVWSVFDVGDNIPICAPPPLTENRTALVIEGEFPIPVWVVGSKQIDDQLHSFLKTLVTAVAFWLRQFDTVLAPYIAELANGRATFVVQIGFDIPSQWMVALQNGRLEDIGHNPAVSSYEHTETGIRLALHPSLFDQLMRPTNQGERELVRALIGSFTSSLHSRYREVPGVLSDPEVNKAIDAIAPLGPNITAALCRKDSCR